MDWIGVVHGTRVRVRVRIRVTIRVRVRVRVSFMGLCALTFSRD